jgi:hypothetical protein
MTCLLILPFDASANRLRDAISRVLRENKLDPVGFDDASLAGARWVDEIYGLLRSCDFVIADITRQNPSVLFELGVAHGLGKRIILVISEPDSPDIPSFLSGYQFFTYDPKNLSAFVARLSRFVQALSRTG